MVAFFLIGDDTLRALRALAERLSLLQLCGNLSGVSLQRLFLFTESLQFIGVHSIHVWIRVGIASIPLLFLLFIVGWLLKNGG